jgi:hypothetical protein
MSGIADRSLSTIDAVLFRSAHAACSRWGAYAPRSGASGLAVLDGFSMTLYLAS